ncbi:related to UBX7 UBX (ubiquitin regulatory X) domain-containing protein [Rhynchosporium agropyri]|uniref:UBX domain-containing protein 2 n=1 Tax=Rhynchosporium agropyri TaxID=914238 RepID=A0A1E1KJM8_9HELO|nr:related to UBX7 UBX (ubiquitin regulatory X) domain-containing protein [Rhynchosporium agropyri]
MFYEGDLQSGIGKALQESKLVGCFVTDSGEESQLWENEFLQEESLKESLTEQTVLLRLVAGSQEAGYLAAIYPLPKTPTFVLIKSGELKEYLISGVSKEDFLRRLGAALESRGPSSQPPPSNSTTTPSTSSNILANMEVNTSELASSSSSAAQNARIQQQTANLTATLAERTRRLAAQKRDLDAAEKAKNAADAKARKEAADAGNPKAVSEQKYAKQQAQRQREAREERARILKRVEDDKATRREKEAQRKADAKAKLEGEKEIEKAVNESSASPLPARGGANAKECAVQVRLFDGSTIRSRFASQGSLMKDIRPWVDEKQDGDVPYTFKQVLSPLPNKNIEMSEEEKSLVALGLTPSATLILIPVSGYTSAYEAGNGGIVSRAASGGYALISSSVGMVAGALGSLLGGTAAPANVQPVSSGPPVPSAAINVRTLRDQRQESKKDDQQFYNGNSTNFKPRREDDEGKDD